MFTWRLGQGIGLEKVWWKRGDGLHGMGLEISVQFLFVANRVQKSLLREVWLRFLTAQTVCRLGTLGTRDSRTRSRPSFESGFWERLSQPKPAIRDSVLNSACLLDVFFQIACGVEDPGCSTGRPSQLS